MHDFIARGYREDRGTNIKLYIKEVFSLKT
jgi:hypothetical protein